jgi:hypothetical protein
MKFTKKAVGKNISVWLAFVLLLAIVLGCGQLNNRTRKDAPDFSITVAELEKEFNRNERAARAKYKGKTLAVKGKVEMKMDDSVILVSPENISFPVQCFFAAADRDSFGQIQRGKEYTLIGVFDGGAENSATTLSDCKLF